MTIDTLSNCCSVTYLDGQAFHRHIPILVRSLGSSCSELLHIISDPPQGSENLLTLVGSFPFLSQLSVSMLKLFYSQISCTWMMLIVILFSGKVLEILTQDTTPSSDLIATVKHLYETKLKVLVTKIFLFLNKILFLPFWFSCSLLFFAGCHNSYSNVVITFQKWGLFQFFFFLPSLLFIWLLSLGVLLVCHYLVHYFPFSFFLLQEV